MLVCQINNSNIDCQLQKRALSSDKIDPLYFFLTASSIFFKFHVLFFFFQNPQPWLKRIRIAFRALNQLLRRAVLLFATNKIHCTPRSLPCKTPLALWKKWIRRDSNNSSKLNALLQSLPMASRKHPRNLPNDSISKPLGLTVDVTYHVYQTFFFLKKKKKYNNNKYLFIRQLFDLVWLCYHWVEKVMSAECVCKCCLI